MSTIDLYGPPYMDIPNSDEGRNVYVDFLAKGKQDGTQQHPFKTISQAVDKIMTLPKGPPMHIQKKTTNT